VYPGRFGWAREGSREGIWLPITPSEEESLIVPASSIAHPEDLGKRARTFLYLVIPQVGLPLTTANTPGGLFETPAWLA
jgi:hypothetical protein